MIKTRKNKKLQSVKKKLNKIAIIEMNQQKIFKFRVKMKKNKVKKMTIGIIYPQRKDF